jgi:quercetin dioxygenase-like cupin family protein
MDELRTFELGAPHAAQALVLVRDAALCAVSGPIWLTIEGEADDIWLQAGERIGLKAGQRVWLSAEQDGARFTVLTQSQVSASGWLAAIAAALGKLMSRTVPPLRSF